MEMGRSATNSYGTVPRQYLEDEDESQFSGSENCTTTSVSGLVKVVSLVLTAVLVGIIASSSHLTFRAQNIKEQQSAEVMMDSSSSSNHGSSSSIGAGTSTIRGSSYSTSGSNGNDIDGGVGVGVGGGEGLPQSVGSGSSSSSSSAADGSAARRPNFMFILIDDLEWDAFGNAEKALGPITPHMDSLMRDGIYFSKYYGQELCNPARSALLTGRYPSSIGTQMNSVQITTSWGLNFSEILLPEVLKTNGNYKTYMVSGTLYQCILLI